MKKYGRIISTAKYLPANVVTNNDLSTFIDTNDEWIYSRTGIKERRISKTENTSDLCIQVASQLVANSEVDVEKIDFIIVATMSPDFHTPSVACLVQSAIGATNAYAFDISVACSGFVYALSLADKLIQTGSQYGLVIGGEVLSKMIDWTDRSTAVLFGDGAGGVILEASDEQMIIDQSLHSDGSRAMSLVSGNVGKQSDNQALSIDPLKMNGRDIFDFATRDVVGSLKTLLGEEKDTVDYYLLHQANARILDIFAKKLEVPRAKFLQNLQNYGNTSAATIPILLHESVENGSLAIGSHQKIVLTGFGGGLTWGNLLIKI